MIGFYYKKTESCNITYGGGCMFLTIKGNQIHYKKSGSGRAIILLHGNGEDWKIFKESIDLLQNSFTVYAIDLPGHGKSYRPKELHYESHASDVYDFIQALQIEKPVLYGFSDGGIVGLILAYRYPNLLSKLIVSGVNINPNGLNCVTRFRTGVSYLITKSKKAWLMLKEPNITKTQLAKIIVPTFLTVGQYDCIRLAHTKFIAENIIGSRLKIFKHCLHGSYVVHSKRIAKYILAI